MRTIISDTKFFGIHPEFCDSADSILQFKKMAANEDTLLLGNIVDLAYCPKNKLDQAEALIRDLRDIAKDRYLSGDREQGFFNLYYIEDKTIYSHGDHLFLGYDKAFQLRMKTKGASAFEIFFANLFQKQSYDNINLSTSFKNAAYELALNNNCKKVVCGSALPSKTIEIEYQGIVITIVSPGVSTYPLK